MNRPADYPLGAAAQRAGIGSETYAVGSRGGFSGRAYVVESKRTGPDAVGRGRWLFHTAGASPFGLVRELRRTARVLADADGRPVDPRAYRVLLFPPGAEAGPPQLLYTDEPDA